MTTSRSTRRRRPAGPAQPGRASGQSGPPGQPGRNGAGRPTTRPAETGGAGDRAASPGRAGRSGAIQLKLTSQRRRQARRQARKATVVYAAVAVVIGAVILTMALVTRASPQQHSVARPALGFTLPATDGNTVSLASYRGHDVVLYFNEGVGCDACFYQMRQFEQHAAELSRAGITILPIVMNPASQVRPELASFGIRTPYLTDVNGAVSRAYGVLGKGMHAGLPGHGFVLVDSRGFERWYGEYPSMYLSAAGLIAQVRAHLPA